MENLNGINKNFVLSTSQRLKRSHTVSDLEFDHVYPEPIKKLSDQHWTPVDVAVKTSKFLVKDVNTRVLDVGSGVGKFCLIGALITPGVFLGVEQRPHFVDIAQDAATRLGAGSVSFIHGNMTDLDWNGFDAFYLFNPFYEHKEKDSWIDQSISHSRYRFVKYVRAVQKRLHAARPGTRVVTYHGFGGRMPPGYRCINPEHGPAGLVKFWIKGF